MKTKYYKLKRYIALFTCIAIVFSFFQFVAFSSEDPAGESNPTTETTVDPEIPITTDETTPQETLSEAPLMGIQAAQAITKDVVIDFSAPWDYSGTDYKIVGSGEFRLNHPYPDYHYILKNVPSGECYVFVGSGNNYNDSPGDYYVTLDNATIRAWQWNMSPFYVSPKATLRLELIGDNKIISTYNGSNGGGSSYVPVISVPPNVDTSKTSLTIATAPGELGTLTVLPSSVLGVAAIGSNGNFGNITIESGTVIANATGSDSIGIGGTGTGTISIEGNANVTAIGGIGIYGGHPGISTGQGGQIYIDPSATVRAYAAGAFAITPTSTYEGATPIINAYITQDGIAGLFENLTQGMAVPILCDTPNVVLPDGYTSFAYNTIPGNYTHAYNLNGAQMSLLPLDNVENGPTTTYITTVTAKMDLTPIPLYKAVPFTVEYYFDFIAPALLSKTGEYFYKYTSDPLIEDTIEATLGTDWKLSGIPGGYDMADVTVESTTISNNPKLVQVVYKTTNTPYTVKYYKDHIDPSNLLGSEQGKIATNANTITQQWMQRIANDYKPSSTQSTIYKDGVWVNNNQLPVVGDMDLSWNPTNNIFYVLYNQVEKMPVTVKYYVDTILSEPIKTIESTESVHVGTLLDDTILQNLFGATWLNNDKPYDYYQNGQVVGAYPVVSLDASKNIVSVVYANSDVNTYTIEYYKDRTDGTLLGTKKSTTFIPVGQPLTAQNIAEEMGANWIDALWSAGYYSGEVQNYPVIQAPPTVNVVKVIYTAKKTSPLPSENNNHDTSPTTSTTTSTPTATPTLEPSETPTDIPTATESPTIAPTTAPTKGHSNPPTEPSAPPTETATPPTPMPTSTTPIPKNLVKTALANVFQVLDEDGMPIGYVKMVTDADGNVTWIDVDEEGIPLGTNDLMPNNLATEAKKENPKTFDGNIVAPFVLLGTMTGSAFTFNYFRRKK